jgi:hypothetical protein
MNGINLEDEDAPKWRVQFKGQMGSHSNKGEGQAPNMGPTDIGAFLNITEPKTKKLHVEKWPRIYGEFIAICRKTSKEDFFPCYTEQKGWSLITTFSTLYATVIYGKAKSGKGFERLLISFPSPQVTIETRPWVIKPCPKPLLKEKLLLFQCPGVKYYSEDKNKEISTKSLEIIWNGFKTGAEREFARSAFPHFAKLASSSPPCDFFSWGFIPFSTNSTKCIWVVDKQGDPNHGFIQKLLNFEFCNVYKADHNGDLWGLCEKHQVIMFSDVTPTKKPPLEFLLNSIGTRDFPFIVVVSNYGITDVYPEPSPNIEASFTELPMTGFIISVADKYTKLDNGPPKIILNKFIERNLKQTDSVSEKFFTSETTIVDEIGSIAEEKQEIYQYDDVLNEPGKRESVIEKTAQLLVNLQQSSVPIPSFNDLVATNYKRPCFTMYNNRENDEATAHLLKETSAHLSFLIRILSKTKRKVKLSLNSIQKHVINGSDLLKRFSAEEIEIMLDYLTIKEKPSLIKNKYKDTKGGIFISFTVIN